MAKYNWAKIRDDYEIHGLSYSGLREKYGCGRATISERAKKDGWDREKTEQAIAAKARAQRDLIEITEQNRTDFGERSVLVDREAERRLRLEGIFMDSLEYNQALANQIIKRKKHAGDVELQDVQVHSQITNRNKDGVMGKPQTQVNIQNNVGTDADSVIERLRSKHEARID